MSKIQNYLRTIYYTFFIIIANIVGYNEKWLYKIGHLLGTIRYHKGYIGKSRSKKSYIETILKALNIEDKKRAKKILKAFWINHQKGFIELFLSRKLNRKNIDESVKFEGLDILEKAMEKGKGVVLAVPHFGNERYIHIGLAIKGYPISVITSKFENATKLVRNIKLGAFINLHPVGFPDDPPRWMYNSLKKNRILQISPPANEGPAGERIEFLNHRIIVSKTPARLALNTGAALIPAFAHRNPDDSHTIVIKPEINITRTDDKKSDIRRITLELMRAFEKDIKGHPEQFYWMWLMIKKDEATKYKL